MTSVKLSCKHDKKSIRVCKELHNIKYTIPLCGQWLVIVKLVFMSRQIRCLDKYFPKQKLNSLLKVDRLIISKNETCCKLVKFQ